MTETTNAQRRRSRINALMSCVLVIAVLGCAAIPMALFGPMGMYGVLFTCLVVVVYVSGVSE